MRRGAVVAAVLAAACGSNGAKPDGGGDGRIDLNGDGGACTAVDAPVPDAGTGGPIRYYPPTRFALGPIYGTGCPDFGGCEADAAATAPSVAAAMAAEAEYQLDQLAAYD